jgi:hypothetical protein
MANIDICEKCYNKYYLNGAEHIAQVTAINHQASDFLEL